MLPQLPKHGEIDYEGMIKLAEDFNGADLRNVCTEAGVSLYVCVCVHLLFCMFSVHYAYGNKRVFCRAQYE